MEITKTSDIKDRYLNILVFGFPGAGKTVFAGTAPSPLILDVEGGTLSLAGKDIMKANINSFEDIKYLYNILKGFDEAKAKKAGFIYVPKTIVIDSGTELQKKIADSVAAENGREVPQLQDWNKVQSQFRKVMRGFRDLPFHFIVTALVEENKDEETGMILRRPSFAGKTVNEIPGFMDLVLYIGVQKDEDGDTDKRVCLTQLNERVFAKDRSGKLPAVVKPDFATIYNLIYNEEKK